MASDNEMASQEQQEARLAEEIESLNLNALLLAQSLLRLRREEALFKFGIDEKTAVLVEGLSIRQIQKIAKVPYFLFPMRFDHRVVWEILSGAENESRGLAHAMIAGAAQKKARS